MIKQGFWEKIVENWAKKEEISIPEIEIEELPDSRYEDFEELDDYLNSLMDEDDEFDCTDFFS